MAETHDTIMRMTPAQRFTVFPLSPGAFPWCIVAGPDGNLWFTLTGLGRIGHINP